MSKLTFTPKTVIDAVVGNNECKKPTSADFLIFDPEAFSANWSAQEAWREIEEYIASYFRWSQSPEGRSMFNWERLYLISTLRAIEMAKSGDLSAIYSRLRVRDLPLSQEERDLLADRAEGKLKFKRGRKKKNSPQAYLFVLLWFEIVEGEEKKDAIIAKIEECFGVSYSHVNAMLGRIYGTSDEAEIRDAILSISASEFWTAVISSRMKDLFSK